MASQGHKRIQKCPCKDLNLHLKQLNHLSCYTRSSRHAMAFNNLYLHKNHFNPVSTVTFSNDGDPIVHHPLTIGSSTNGIILRSQSSSRLFAPSVTQTHNLKPFKVQGASHLSNPCRLLNKREGKKKGSQS